jgi:hypothetical protein
MRRNVFHFGCGLIVLALAAGCESPSGPTAAVQPGAIQMTQDRRSVQEVLADILEKAGLVATDQVLRTAITFPPPAAGDKNPLPAWQGCFAGQEKAVLNADDRVLVIAKTIPPAPRYVFNPFIRTWSIAANQPNAEGNLLWVLFDGKARDFVTEVAKARDAHELLSSLVRKPRPVTGATFPAQISIDEIRNDLLELGLSALDEHLRTAHANGQPCNPEVQVYVKPAAGKPATGK